MLPLYVKCTIKFQIIFTQRFILLISSVTPTHNYFSHFQYSELTIQISGVFSELCRWSYLGILFVYSKSDGQGISLTLYWNKIVRTVNICINLIQECNRITFRIPLNHTLNMLDISQSYLALWYSFLKPVKVFFLLNKVRLSNSKTSSFLRTVLSGYDVFKRYVYAKTQFLTKKQRVSKIAFLTKWSQVVLHSKTNFTDSLEIDIWDFREKYQPTEWDRYHWRYSETLWELLRWKNTTLYYSRKY